MEVLFIDCIHAILNDILIFDIIKSTYALIKMGRCLENAFIITPDNALYFKSTYYNSQGVIK